MEADLIAALIELGGESLTIGILIWILFDERRERRIYSQFVMSMIERRQDAKEREAE